jgi:hypothetical protein
LFKKSYCAAGPGFLYIPCGFFRLKDVPAEHTACKHFIHQPAGRRNDKTLAERGRFHKPALQGVSREKTGKAMMMSGGRGGFPKLKK